jgi:hypothetical protein
MSTKLRKQSQIAQKLKNLPNLKKKIFFKKKKKKKKKKKNLSAPPGPGRIRD